MKTLSFFKQQINEATNNTVNNFLWHLSAPSTHPKHIGDDLHEAFPLPVVVKSGQDAQASGNMYQHMRKGFHAAFPDDEAPEITKQKAKEAQKHFRTFMAERGGHTKDNKLNLLSENGKTKLSSGVGVQTVGLALAPHTTAGLNKFNLCPKASKECAANCLGLKAGGNRQFPENSLRRKTLVTQYVTEHPEHTARLMSHELSENEKWSEKHGYKPGFRPNVTSDLPYEHLMPKKFFDRHEKTQIYDYTKIASRLNNKDMPKNYSLALSHTGTGHDESNDKDAIKHLENGHVVAMVYQRGKDVPKPTHVEDVRTGKRYPIANGDDDDNVYDRHTSIGVQKTQGVVSGLKLKGVKNSDAGHFANKVDPDGVIRINK